MRRTDPWPSLSRWTRAAACAGVLACSACAPAAFVEVVDVGSNPGALRMFEYAPGDVASPAPLLLVLHGCMQDHGLADAAGFLPLAEQHGVVVVAAEQQATNNVQSCFNWFEGRDTTRDSGELLSLKQMVDAASARHDIDPARVFVTGVSAGATMAGSLLAAYPEVFAGGALVAGGPHGCTTDVVGAGACMAGLVEHDGEEWAARVREASEHEGPWPRVLVLHGEDDVVVSPKNVDALVAQWTAVHGVSDAPSSTSTLTTAKGEVRVAVFGEGVVESVRFAGVGHALPNDPDGGCGQGAAFLEDLDFCTAAHVVERFGLAREATR